mgnify:CR=1 FL=1
MTFRPLPGPAAQILVPSAFTTLVLGGLLAWLAATSAVGPATFVLLLLASAALVLGVILLLYAFVFRSLAYQLDRNGLQIRAGGWRITVPMESIGGIYAMPQDILGTGFRGLRFPGHNVGRERSLDGLTFVSVATAPPEQCLYVRAGSRVYAISPEEPDSFRRTYEMERALGPLRPLAHALDLPPLLRSLFWRDRLGRTLTAVAVLGVLVLLGLAFWRYPSLPEQIPMHFGVTAEPDRLAPPRDIFYLPIVGMLVLVVNSLLGAWAYGRERVLSYFLWSGAVVVQAVLILALRTVTS